jgi:hypothetical protein
MLQLAVWIFLNQEKLPMIRQLQLHQKHLQHPSPLNKLIITTQNIDTTKKE